jgi:hypothetical protein
LFTIQLYLFNYLRAYWQLHGIATSINFFIGLIIYPNALAKQIVALGAIDNFQKHGINLIWTLISRKADVMAFSRNLRAKSCSANCLEKR